MPYLKMYLPAESNTENENINCAALKNISERKLYEEEKAKKKSIYNLREEILHARREK